MRESLHEERQAAEVVVHQRDGRRIDRHLAARGAHRDADVAGRERRGIVDAVADDGDAVALGLAWPSRTRPCSAAGTRPRPPRTPISAATRSATGLRSPLTIAMRRMPASCRPRMASAASARVWSCRPTQPMHWPLRAMKRRLKPVGLVEVHRLEEIVGDAVVLEPGARPTRTPGALDGGADAAAGGLLEIRSLSERDARLFGELDQRLGGRVVAEALGARGEAQQLGRGDVAERVEPADDQLAGGERAGLVEDEGVDARGGLEVGDVLDQDARGARRRTARRPSRSAWRG